MTAGGSGGHITPILAVAHELKVLDPTAEIMYIGQKGDQLSDIPAADPNIDAVYAVSAGKLRRYANEGWRQLLDLHTQALNMRDGFRVLRGLWQSYWLIRRLKPDVIFTRGGFVSVPVALAGRLNHVPYITHDSDSVPSLANRIIARWASVHAVALPTDLYPYPQSKTAMVGVPVSTKYQPVTAALTKQYRNELGLENYKHIVLLTGGGNGSGILNQALAANAQYLLAAFPELAIVHIAGRKHEADVVRAYDALDLGAARTRVQVHGFVTDLYRYSGAADVIIARSGATTIAEFALQARACIVVPAPQLTGGHQVKNASAFVRDKAVLQLTEDQIEQPERLGRTIGELLQDDAERTRLGHNLAKYAHPHAAAELAVLVLKIGSGERYVRS
jgi:UDP-N-acetylglucosamine--N-acetylmuramyl-(pentapeptide) pyrophosphoryl-undecaprenol N-acetylglucosamine transferase